MVRRCNGGSPESPVQSPPFGPVQRRSEQSLFTLAMVCDFPRSHFRSPVDRTCLERGEVLRPLPPSVIAPVPLPDKTGDRVAALVVQRPDRPRWTAAAGPLITAATPVWRRGVSARALAVAVANGGRALTISPTSSRPC